jgi:UDP-N-acetylmuramoyl-L-alanyl-D-glutamate--2,6-diaminopimelate ligase
VREVNVKKGRIITVFGCGGNRDKGKRPMMGKIAAELSDMAIITSDNPRYEDPADIIRDIESGVPEKLQDKVISIPDREQAIKTACKMAANLDVVVVAGKGHEKYQEVQGIKHSFDDKVVLAKYLNN